MFHQAVEAQIFAFELARDGKLDPRPANALAGDARFAEQLV